MSLTSARAAFDRLRAIANPLTPARFLELDDATLKAAGFSRQKTRYGRELARAVLSGSLDLAGLPYLDDNVVRAALTRVPGIGRWTTDIYLPMALGRPDVWLGREQDLAPFYEAARHEPKLAAAAAQAKGRILRCPTLFEDVVKTIRTTNTAWSSTKRMVANVVSRFGDPLPRAPAHRAFPAPAQLAASDEATLRNAARLGYRAPYVLDVEGAGPLVQGVLPQILSRRLEHPMAEKDTSDTKPGEEARPTSQDQLVTTQHAVIIAGQEIRYTVTAGTIILKEEAEKTGEKAGEAEGEKPKASVFFIAYTRDDVPDKARRPLTFSFNGGPGSSSVWLHLGLLGPRRVVMAEDGGLPPPPFRLTDNEFSLLDVTDLVFIDPVSTGFSRPVVGEKAKEFHGFKKDIESVGDFIRLYTTRYGRWPSPKFLIGESYGTTRAAGLSGYLQERHGLYLNGIMLISSILDFSTARFNPGNDLPYILFLPTYAATAWYHGRLPADLQACLLPEVLAEVKQFALGDYTLALMQGATLPLAARAGIVAKLARYTGLAADWIDRAELRIEIHRFTKELLRDRRRTVGRLDSRFTGMDRDAVGETHEYDPSLTNITGPYTAALNDYVRGELKFESDLPYEILNPKVWPWSYAQHENQYVNVAETLRKAMTINPYLKVFVANGYYDLATPYCATEYTFSHLGLDPSLAGHVSMAYYPAGHMMYIHLPALAVLREDLAGFLRNAMPA